MPNVRSLARSFNAGEITPEMYGRIDDPKFQTGLALCRNMIVTPHGPVFNRPGTAFVREVKDSVRRARLLPFAYSTDQTMILEFGHLYVRFHTQGATLMSGGVPYEVVSPYVEEDLFNLHYVQSADVLTIVHPNYPVQELRRLGALSWTLTPPSFVSTLVPPTFVTAVATVTGTGLTTQEYVVTSLDALGQNESAISGADDCDNNLFAVGAYNTVSWVAAPGASRYNVYRKDNGLYGLIGQAEGTEFIDDNFTPELSKTPPEQVDPFTSAGNYPGAVTYFEQRKGFAGTLEQPQNFWLTRSGTELNLSYSIPARDDDAISYRVAARENNTIRHMVPLSDLILLTSSAELRVSSSGGALTAASTTVKPQSYIGSSNVQPVLVNNNLLFAAARGGHMRELAFVADAGGYLTGDVSLRAPHLFDGLTIIDMAYAKAPQPVVWVVSSNGKLLGLTYVPEQNVGAWHQHDTDGLFETVAVVAEGEEDAVYVIVKRTIGGASVRYVERFASRRFADPADAFFVDAGVSYSGPAVTTISAGLGHLEGQTVAILGDGAVRPPQVVTGGQITLDQPASKLQIGLAYEADVQTLPAAFEAQASGQGRQKNINAVWVRVERSSGWSVGSQLSKLVEAKLRTNEAPGDPVRLQSGEIKTPVGPDWQNDGQIFVRQANPLPLTLVSMSMETSIGG